MKTAPRPWPRAPACLAALFAICVHGQALAHRKDGVDYINVKAAPYNAAGKLDANDTKKIQAAIDDAAAAGKSVYFPPGVYVIDATLDVRGSGVLLFGEPAAHDYEPRAAIKALKPFHPKRPAPMIRFTAHKQGLQGLTVEGPGKNSNMVGVLFKKTNKNQDDVDGMISNTQLRSLSTGVQIAGRGLRVDNSSFVGIQIGVELLDWPDCKTKCVGLQSSEHGVRGFHISDNRSHNVPTFVRNEGNNAHNLKGLILANNLVDIGDTLFKGGASQASFTGNVVTNMQFPAFDFTRPVENVTITGNVIGGREGSDEEASQDQPLHGIAFHDVAQHVAISGNTFSNINQSAIRFSGAQSDFIAISGNVFSDVVNEATDLAAHAPILFAGNTSRVSITGNGFHVTRRGRSGPLYAIRAPKKLASSQVHANTISEDMTGVIPRTDHVDSSVQAQ